MILFCKENEVNFEQCGKIVLATNNIQAKKLLQLKINGEKNGLEDLKILDSNELKEIEPNAVGKAALFVPESGIIDYKQTMPFVRLR